MTSVERQKQTAARRRSKHRITLWLTPETMATLQAWARERHAPVCDVAERFIRRGLEAGATHQLEQTALPQLADAVRAALEEHARHGEDRLAKLLTRNIIASDTARRLLFAAMARQWGVEAVRPVHDSARSAAINALKERGWAAALRLDAEEAGE